LKLEVNAGALPRANTNVPTDVPAERLYALDRKPERMAWLVLFGAFTACIALWILVPVLGYQFLRFSTLAQNSSIEYAPTRPDQITPVRVSLPNASQPIAVIDLTDIPENSRIETDPNENSRAIIQLFENSNVFVFPDSQIVLQEIRKPQFSVSEQPNRLVIEHPRGLVRYAVAPPLNLSDGSKARATQFLVRTPHFDVWLNPGSYRIQVTDQGSQVSVTDGSAAVRSRDGSRELVVEQGLRVIAEQGKPLADPIPAAQDLLAVNRFQDTLDCAPNSTAIWKCYIEQGGDSGDVNGSIGVVTLENREAVQIKRTNSGQNSAVTGIRQMIDRDVSDFRTLNLYADVRVDSHNLSGGGYLSSEYPLIIRMKYKDVDGNETEYVRGFYAQNDTRNPTANGELVPRGIFVPIESSNLLASLPIKPFRILSLEVYASGWDYESYVSNVRLKAE